jgi:hypothetical protein
MAVNVGSVWASGLDASIFAHSKILKAAPFLGLMFANSIVHIIPWVLQGKYNPGLLSGTLVFLPTTLWIFYLLLESKTINKRQFFAIIGWGFLAHILTIVSIIGMYYHILPHVLSCAFWYTTWFWTDPLSKYFKSLA